MRAPLLAVLVAALADGDDLVPGVLRAVEERSGEAFRGKGYWWPRDGSVRFDGTTRDLVYRGETIARGDPERRGRTYCCGLTFEVWFRAWELWAAERGVDELRIAALPAARLHELKADWFNARGNRGGPADALVPRGLGRRVERLEEARAGDFVQLWRGDGSGHSVVFRGWERADGRIVGLRYWSTQKATDGIGERVERFDGDRPVLRDQLFIVRAFVPAPPR
jgi:hypothetical protein